jgi:hypothetical protein
MEICAGLKWRKNHLYSKIESNQADLAGDDMAIHVTQNKMQSAGDLFTPVKQPAEFNLSRAVGRPWQTDVPGSSVAVNALL